MLFEFGEDAVVDHIWMAGERTACSVGGACYYRGHFQIIADEAADARARTGNTMDEACVVYAYADEDFELPVMVTDSRHTRWLLEKTSFVRLDVAVGAAMPSAWYENVPGSAVDRLLSVPRTQPPNWRPTLGTNCEAANPCQVVAILDTTRPWFAENALIDEREQPIDTADIMLLQPGQYTVRVGGRDTHATFDAEAGRRYEVEYDDVCCFACGPWRVKIPGGDEARSQLCSAGEQRVSSFIATSWIEDAATSRVVGGNKWCASDADCPASQCSRAPGQPSGVCAVPELR